jgi:hypothetical protein
MTQVAVAATPSQTTPTQAPPTTAIEVLNGKEVLNAKPEATETKTLTEDGKISPKFQALLKRERLTLDKERAATQRERDLEDRLKQFEEREKRVTEFETLKKTNPLKALEMLGLSYQELTEVALKDGQVPAELQVKQVEERLDTFLRQQQELEQRRIENEKHRAEEEETRTITEFKTEISDYIKQNSERYEFIAFEQNDGLVYDVIEGHYNRTKDPETGTGEVLTIAQAADKVEEYLEQKYDKARQLKKLQAMLAPRPAPKTPEKSINTRSQAPKTLNNQLSASSSTVPDRVLTDEERVARAIAWARGIRP